MRNIIMKNNKLLINNTLNVKGAILDVQDWINIQAHYERAAVQEVVFEAFANKNDNISEDEALKIADKAISIMDDYHLIEEDAINEASKALGYKKPIAG